MGETGPLDPAVERNFQETLALLERLGAAIEEIDLPHLPHAVAVYYILAPSEASSNLGRYDGVRYGLRVDPGEGIETMFKRTREAGFGAEVKRRIMLGTFALSAGYKDAYYDRAMAIRALLRRDFARAFERVDLILMPTSPVPAFRLGERIADPLQMYLVDAFTLPVNLAGLPAISLPSGFTAEGLPLGVQMIADRFAEDRLLAAARTFERAGDHHRRRPPLP
jgi:aspartyl-tRNA(Asn)/glutamyl-tRNA(Gln) amidotransferase subunit A